MRTQFPPSGTTGLAVVGLASFFLSAIATAATVTGTVTDAGTHAALVSKVVAAYAPAGSLQASATTDSAGHYTLTVPSGNYRILAYDPNGSFATTFGGNADSFEASPIVSVISSVTGLDFSLQRGGTVSGTVSGAAGPLSGITVAAYNLSGSRRSFTQTNASGGYSILLPPGQFKIAAYDNGGSFAPRFYTDQYAFNGATPVGIAASIAAPGIDVHLELAAHLGGTVADFDTAAALPGMALYAYTTAGTIAAQATSDGTGLFTMTVPPGAYKIVAADLRLAYATGYLGDTHSFAQSQAVSLPPGGNRFDLQMVLHRGGTLTGQVSGEGKVALPSIVVAAYNADGSQRASTRSDTFGTYTLVLPGGSFRLAAYDEGLAYATQFFPTRNTLGEASDVPVVPATRTDSIDFALVRGARITGTITESGTGVVVSGIGVGAYDANGEQVTGGVSGSTGAYAMVAPPGTYRFAAFDTALRYATAYSGGAANYEAAAAYPIASNGLLAVDFTLTRGLQVGGRVSDTANALLSGIEVGALDLDGNRVATAVAESGIFTLVLKPGSYKVVASDPMQRYRKLYYSNSGTFAGGSTLVVQSGSPPPSIEFVLAPLARHRAASH